MHPLGKSFDIVPAIAPLDLQTARTGDWCSMKNAAGVCIVFFKGAGTAGDDPDITVQQATDVAGTSAKDLDAVATVYKKQGTLTSVGTWTKVTQTADALYDADGTSAEEQAVYVMQIEADQLDKANGFDCINVSCSDVGSNAQLGCALYILYGLRYPSAPENLSSAIVD
jgi:hypothetical protein